MNSGAPYKYGTFAVGPNAFGERFIVDLRKERIPAAVRLYAFLKYSTIWPARGTASNPSTAPGFLIDLWNESYRSKLPCKVKLYGTNDDPETVNLASCVLLNDFSESPLHSEFPNAWSYRTDDYFSWSQVPSMQAATEAEIDATEPVYMEMLCNYSGQGYRYLIFVVEDTFDGCNGYGTPSERNTDQYITFNELEICVKKD